MEGIDEEQSIKGGNKEHNQTELEKIMNFQKSNNELNFFKK